MLYRSCSVFHRESKKFGFAFFWFVYDFLRILQDSAPSPRSRRDNFTNRPSNFADRPLGRKIRLQLGPLRHGRRRELNSGEGKARLGRKRAGECSVAHLRPIPRVGRLRGRAGEGARRHRPSVAAVSSSPAKLRHGRANTWHWRLQGILVKAARVPHDCGKEQEGELAVEAPMADDDVGLRVGQCVSPKFWIVRQKR
jgi:hypothetical protein